MYFPILLWFFAQVSDAHARKQIFFLQAEFLYTSMLTSCKLVKQRSNWRTTVKKEEFFVGKYKNTKRFISMKAFCSMDLILATQCEYRRIIEFNFEFFSVQNFKAFFWNLLFLKSVYAITQNLLDQSFWNFAQYFFT